MPVTIGRPQFRIIKQVYTTRGGAGTSNLPPPSPYASISVTYEPTQDGGNPRIWTVNAALVPESVRAYWQGQRLRTSLLGVVVAGGVTTITLDATVAIEAGDFLEVEGIVAA